MFEELTRLKGVKDQAQRMADQTDSKHVRLVCAAIAIEVRKMLRTMRAEIPA